MPVLEDATLAKRAADGTLDLRVAALLLAGFYVGVGAGASRSSGAATWRSEIGYL